MMRVHSFPKALQVALRAAPWDSEPETRLLRAADCGHRLRPQVSGEYLLASTNPPSLSGYFVARPLTKVATAQPARTVACCLRIPPPLSLKVFFH